MALVVSLTPLVSFAPFFLIFKEKKKRNCYTSMLVGSYLGFFILSYYHLLLEIIILWLSIQTDTKPSFYINSLYYYYCFFLYKFINGLSSW